jgi:hypothetical protein
MQGVIGALLGVPATILVAGGLGLIGVTIYSRLVRRKGKEPIRWAHLGLGAFLFAMGVALLWVEVVAVGAS